MFEDIRANFLFSLRRAVFGYSLALLVSLSDMWLIHALGISTPDDLLTQTLVHGTGLYLGFTLMALFNRPAEIPN